MRRTLTWLAAALALSAGAARAEVGTDRARELFLAGAEAFEAGEYDAALEAFEASYDLSPVTSVLYNIAMCQRALLRYGASMDSFERYLDATGDRLSEERRAEVLALLEDMEARVSTLELRVAPEQAEVLLDGEAVPPAGRRRLRLLPGVHAVEVRAEGYEGARRVVELDGGGAAVVAVVLEPLDEGSPGGGAGPGEVHRQWWFWVALVGAAALVGTGVGLGVGLGSPQGLGRGDWEVELP